MTGNHNRVHDEIVKRLRASLEKAGGMTIHLKSFTARKIGRKVIAIPLTIEKGWPDIICLRRDGSTVFYEIKTGCGILNSAQRIRFKEIARRGAKIYIVNERMEKRLFKYLED